MILIPEASKTQQRDIESIIEEILSQKYAVQTADTSDLEREIDRLVYESYGLTEEEIAVIED